MKVLDLCAACHCYVKHGEPRCPFCGAIARRPVVPRFAVRMNRGRWAALGSTLTLMSCTDSGTPASSGVPDATGSVLSDAGLDVARDSASDSGVVTVDSGGSDGDARVVDTNDDRSSDARVDAYQDVGREGGDGEFDVRIDASADASRDAIDDADLDARRDGDTSDASQGDTRDVVADDTSDASQGDTGDVDADDTSDPIHDATVDSCLYPADVSDNPDGNSELFVCDVEVDGVCRVCNRRTEVCARELYHASCRTYGALGEFPAQCMPEPSCACIRPLTSPWCSCVERDGAIFVDCGPCYGCPPPRHEKTPTAALTA